MDRGAGCCEGTELVRRGHAVGCLSAFVPSLGPAVFVGQIVCVQILPEEGVPRQWFAEPYIRYTARARRPAMIAHSNARRHSPSAALASVSTWRSRLWFSRVWRLAGPEPAAWLGNLATKGDHLAIRTRALCARQTVDRGDFRRTTWDS
jgi:hypothetical protein